MQPPDTKLSMEKKADILLQISDRLEAFVKHRRSASKIDKATADTLKRFRADAKNLAEGGSLKISDMFSYVSHILEQR
jgi:hypothetical protein